MRAPHQQQYVLKLRGWRHLLSCSLYPFLLLGGAFLTWLMMTVGSYPHFLSVTCIAACTGLILWLLETWMPYTIEWRATQSEAALDLSHLLMSTGLTSIFVNTTILGGLVWVGSGVSDCLNLSIWPTQWPLVLQVALGLTLGELGAYWVHRICHLSDVGWRIHVLHHSAEKLHVWASGRNHPFNVVCTVSLQAALPILAGATPEVLSLISVMTGINGFLQHANVDMRSGRMINLIFSTPELHRWHHASDLKSSHTNFGNNLIIWDHVFGTYTLPATPPPTELGVEGLSLPHSISAHLAIPFTYQARQPLKQPLDLTDHQQESVRDSQVLSDRPVQEFISGN